nr:adult cement protein 3 [Chelonibia testudinaria]
MFRLCVLAALAVAATAHIYPSSRSLAGVDLSPYWQSQYCAPIRLRYPYITDLTCYYIVYYYIHHRPRPFLSHLHIPGLSAHGTLSQQYWVQYISQLVDMLPRTFYSDTGFHGHLNTYLRGYYPGVVDSSVYHDHLALSDTYFGSHLLAPRGWSHFEPFYRQHVLGHSQNLVRHYSLFPSLNSIISGLRGYNYGITSPYFSRASLTPLTIGDTRLTAPRLSHFDSGDLWFPRQTLRGLYNYLRRRNYPWQRWYNQIQKTLTMSRIRWGQGYTGLACHSSYGHLSFLCPAWEHGLLPVLRLRFATFPQRIIYSKRTTFHNFLSGFLYQWRPTDRVYSHSLVTDCLLAFDNFACSWLGTHFSDRFSICRPNQLWYSGFGGCYKGQKCFG